MRIYKTAIREKLATIGDIRVGGSVIAREDHEELAMFISSLLPEKRIVRHLARGSDYDVFLENASVQCKEPIKEGDRVAVYIEESGRGWVRPVAEFNDGRFETISVGN